MSMAVALTMALPHLQAGKMRVLLISRKWPGLPNMPTFGELGYKPDLGAAWFAFFAPAGIPEDVKDTLVQAFEKAVKNPEVKAKVEKLGFTVGIQDPCGAQKDDDRGLRRSHGIGHQTGLEKITVGTRTEDVMNE